MAHIICFNNFITILSFLLNLLLIVSGVARGYMYFTKKRYVKGVLGYDNTPVQVSQSIFEIEGGSGIKKNYVTHGFLIAMNNIVNLFNVINQKFYFAEGQEDAKNEVNIGGFYANKRVNAYFKKYFPQFKYLDKKEKEEAYRQHYMDIEMFEFTNDGTKGFKVGNIFLETTYKKSDYAFLIKLVKADFNNDNEKTVHILFGGDEIGTIKATEYLLTHYKQIYELYGENHYFFALEISGIDNSINYSKGIIDLTDRMFGNSK